MFGIDHTVIGADGTPRPPILSGEYRPLMLFYSAGFAAISLLFIVMHWHAWRRREELELDRLERYLTWSAIVAQALSLSLALTSIGLAWVGGALLPWSGLIYFLMAPAHGIHGFVSGVRADRILRQEQRPAAPGG